MWAQYSLIIICHNIGSPRNYHSPFETNGKVVVLGVPILKHFRVIFSQQYFYSFVVFFFLFFFVFFFLGGGGLFVF